MFFLPAGARNETRQDVRYSRERRAHFADDLCGHPYSAMSAQSGNLDFRIARRTFDLEDRSLSCGNVV